MSLLVLTATDVDRAASKTSPQDLLYLVAQVFIRLSSRTGFTAPPRLATRSENHVSLFMPAHIQDIGTAVKVVSIPHEQKASNGLPASTLVLDEVTGGVKAIVNARNLTALRTAAASLLATRMLGPAQPQTLVAYGAGKQIEAHIELHLSAYPSITMCTVVNRSLNDRLRTLIARFRSRYRDQRPEVDFRGITLSGQPLDHGDQADPHPENLREVVFSADVICTATSATAPLFPSAWVQAGTHINLVGSFTPEMHEVDTHLIERAGKVTVDSRQACFIEAGELIKARLGEQDMIELGEIVSIGEVRNVLLPVQEVINSAKSGDITIFKQVGVSLLDVAIANVVVARAESMGLGTRVDAYDPLE